MCGIIGYTGQRQAQPILLDGLARLEYRGYDSAGIAVTQHGSISLCKTRGRLQHLLDRVEATPLPGCTGVGHTRWATHGEPSVANAHPHTDGTGRIALVHNGIIENHDALRSMLQQQGCIFASQTDTEVAAHLLGILYKGDMVPALREVQSRLIGSYALAVLCADTPDALYCMRRDSPLIVGLGDGENYVASDIPALIAHTRQVELLEDGEIAVLLPHAVTVYDRQGAPRALRPMHVDWDVEAAEKGGFAHFMLKEIHEEPAALKKTFSAHVDTETLALREDAFPITQDEAKALSGMTIAACGTAYHAGIVGKYLIEQLARLPAQVDLASEFRYRDPIIGRGDLFLAVSQSGETADTLAAMREASRLGAKVMALTNVVGSTIAREAGQNVLHTYAGPEIAVASTKAYITQVEMLTLLAIDLAVKRGHMSHEAAQTFLAEMAEIPAKAQRLLAREGAIRSFAERYSDHRHVFYIGRGIDSALAMESSLKLKEVSYIMSEAYAAGELKHGTIALIEEGTLVCTLLTQEHLADKTLSNVREVRARGARTLIVCPESLREKAAREADELWCFPDCRSELTPLLAIIPMQLLAYYMAVSRGCDVDKPRNLAKSVTVE